MSIERKLWSYTATIEKIVDADTIHLKVDLGFYVEHRICVRLARIDAWEIRGEERAKGLLAKARVQELCPVESSVLIQTTLVKGKYGRFIAEIFFSSPLGWENLNDVLVQEGHAEYVTYD